MTPVDDIAFACALYVAIDALHGRRRLKPPILPADVKTLIHHVKEATKAGAGGSILIELNEYSAQLFVEFLYDFDHDMPPRPICKALGPLVGDHMMNAKLDRLDDIADKLGPMMILLSGLLTQRAPR